LQPRHIKAAFLGELRALIEAPELALLDL